MRALPGPSFPGSILVDRCLVLLAAGVLLGLASPSAVGAQPSETRVAEAGAWGRESTPTIHADAFNVLEAEEFETGDSSWQALPFGRNYYAATFANCFLSRKAFLGAPERRDPSVATRSLDVADAGRYLVLVRYEAAYRFQTQFRVRIVQQGRVVFERDYGGREQPKIWAFREGIKPEVGWSWGAGENVVWQGHDAWVELSPGGATLEILAQEQPEPAARRNIDLVMLTTDVDEVTRRLEQENYLPLDGLLTQQGDVRLRVTNRGDSPLVFTGRAAPGGGNWQQHSPYWVHLRDWQVPSITVPPRASSDWVEVGHTMDSLADGQWTWTGDGPYVAEFGVVTPSGQIQVRGTFEGDGDLRLAADADMRYGGRVRRQEQVLTDLLAELRAANPAPHGRVPTETPIYASTFEPLDAGDHARSVQEFQSLFGLVPTAPDAALGHGYDDVRGVPTDRLEAYLRDLGDRAANIRVVSLGDEISLPAPAGPAIDTEFRDWLRSIGLEPSDVDPAFGNDWDRVRYAIDEETRDRAPATYYWSMRYRNQFGILAIKQRTDLIRRHLPRAGVGANFSPHYPQEHLYLGETFKWVDVFRQDGMTLPWSEDYIWQVPVGSPQMNHINLDLFRAANRHHPDRDIAYYVMPHMPNNTPSQWRRLFYGALAHGMTIVDLFEFRPVQVAYTENHVDDPAMYEMVLRSLRELGTFEDVIQRGRVRNGRVGLWFGQTGDIWGDGRGSKGAAKRALYLALRHRQVPVDIVIEADAFDGVLDEYDVLVLADAHVERAASERMARWVEDGGRLLATSGAGMWDETDAPNTPLRTVLGVETLQDEVESPEPITWIKQDLPFATPLDTIALPGDVEPMPVFGAITRIRAASGRTVVPFSGGDPAIVQGTVGRGRATYLAFLPGLSYFHPAIPLRPVDRGATDDAMVHLLPTTFDPRVVSLLEEFLEGIDRPVECDHELVETTMIESDRGWVVPLVNWSGRPIPGLRVRVRPELPRGSVTLAGGGSVQIRESDDGVVYELDLDVADALIFR